MTAEKIALVALTFALSWMAVGLIRVFAPRLGFMDVPNQRSSHTRPTPRAGGVGFVAVSSAAIAISLRAGIIAVDGAGPVLVGGLLVAATGLVDDRWHLSALARLLAYSAAALTAVGGGIYLHRLEWPGMLDVQLGVWGIPLTVLWLVGLTNIYNFMDGIDGIASVQAVTALAAAGLLALGRGDAAFAALALVLGSGVLGFLPHNWPPARIFMGDVGSAFLGYWLAALAVVSPGSPGQLPFLLWVILLAPFLFDGVFTLLARISRGERWYEAHRQHLYQRMVRCGWSHLRVTSIYLGADIALALIAALAINERMAPPIVPLLVSVPLAAIFLLARSLERRAVSEEREAKTR